MAEAPPRHVTYEELLRRFASAVRASQLYAASHPLLQSGIENLLETTRSIHQQLPSIAIGIVDKQLVVADTPLPKASAGMADFIKRLSDNRIERIVLDRGVTIEELVAFVRAIGALAAKDDASEKEWPFAHIRVGRIEADAHQADGIGSDMAAIRRLYSSAVTVAEGVWESAAVEGKPDLPSALHAVGGLAETLSLNPTAFVALTAMRNYDNYTYTHMVNVSILTMAQARALGIEGRLLIEFGLSALMHDIGKVRTPKEILNKPEKLTDQEFVIMRRHTVDGAELLRSTPEMPQLAGIVAFEHHLRLDGSGYPLAVKRPTLNLGTMLCGIADVYDAMRAQRVYQQAFPTDRILAVLERNDGTQFDQRLVRRFIQLLGIYPPGTLVRLGTGEIAVVTRIHAPDPPRPRVRVLFAADGVKLERPVDRNLWEQPADTAGTAGTIVTPLDPAAHGIDPLEHIQ